MGRMYSVPIDFSYTTAAIDLIEIAPGTNTVCILHEIKVGQSDSETSEATKAEIVQGVTTGSGGTVVGAVPLDPGDAADSATVETGNTTPSTGGTLIQTEGWNVLAGFHYLPTPEARHVIPGGTVLAVRLPALGQTVTLEGYAVFEELG